MLAALGTLLLLEALGLAAAPLTAMVLGRLPGAGLGFAKVLGLLLVTWLVWMLGSLGVPYGVATIAGALAALAVAGASAAVRLRSLGRRQARLPATPRGPLGRWRAARLTRLALPPHDPVRRRLFWGAEAVFAVAYAGMTLLAAYSPDVWGTEKPMDMAFVNAVNASRTFPPHDPWLAGAPLNYYYVGHLMLAWPAKLFGEPPDTAYLIGWGLLFALTASAVFTLAGTLWAAARSALGPRAPRGGPVAVGLLAVALCTVLGNLAGVRSFFAADRPPGDYDWFAPSRVIPGTINEFPAFSFTLGDLHAHVLALPVTLLVAGIALQLALAGPCRDVVGRAIGELLVAALAVGILYAVNSWSLPVAAALVAGGVLVWLRDRASAGRRGFALAWLGVVGIASVVLTLPFWLNYDPAASGLGIVGERRSFGRFAGDMVLIYGVLAWPLLAAGVDRLLAARHPWRVAIWTLVALAVAGSLLASADLAGALVLAAATGGALAAALRPAASAPERFLWLLVAMAAGLLLVPELVYVRDAFDHGSLFRMNTVFKLGYQAYVLLAVAAACALPWASLWLPRRAWQAWAAGAAVLALLALVYPWAGTYARKEGFHRGPSLDGLSWLRARAPGDPAAIAWLREHAPGDAVVLEAAGPDYSEFGDGRIATYTGRPAIVEWPGHELQWAHDVGSRQADVQALYTGTSVDPARALLASYRVRYVVVGPLERASYGDRGVAKWDALGRRVFSQAGTTVWQVA